MDRHQVDAVARSFLLVLLFAWAQFLVRAVTIYLGENFPQMEIRAPSPSMFRDFFEQQGSSSSS